MSGSTPHKRPYFKFFSRSKDFRARYLSNFQASEIEWDGHRFPSVEHAFGYAKYKYSSGPAPDFTTSGEHAKTFGKKIKQLHGKGHMKSIGCTLDVKLFNAEKVGIMRELIRSRLQSDTKFKRILRCIQKTHVIIHQENRGRQPYWGGRIKDGKLVGKNVLGKIMQTVQ